MVWSGLINETRLAARSLAAYATDWVSPTLRLGVTGLSRSGKTVFITALVHGLLQASRWPVFEAGASGRIARVRLVPQPDDGVPRFPYEDHLQSLTGPDRAWPEGTKRISEIRLAIDFASNSGLMRGSEKTLTLDIVDYPGEWLLDLPLLAKSYADWSRESLDAARRPPRAGLAAAWLADLGQIDAFGLADEAAARRLSDGFTAYLKACRDERVSLSTLPPGRFLLPGEMEGSPALTFAPLDLGGRTPPGDSLAALMERRFESYKRLVVMPFYANHFATLDRQIVLVDALAALNAGPPALADLEVALSEVLTAFRPGANSILSAILARRIDRILFAATKADHLHQTSHDRLEALLKRLTDRAIGRAQFAGAKVDAVALASLRATRETTVTRKGRPLACIVGAPLPGERVGDEIFDGLSDIAAFPGELPVDPDVLFAGPDAFRGEDYRFVRFRPPLADPAQALPHIRLDRAVEFLIGDRLA
ncbi:YcjX family protein [Phreatobacter aquaticus]|uniref:YcjX family protein n=1 Tax=Phreatobacter aquaticus TaxID=2570229 RepID=A0A4D7QVW0_9HYPH|nr:YcjX family protein [Phreatobacter aquaticus]QCK88102.1 YcjX family protein [Phreatobacter aquaticus]